MKIAVIPKLVSDQRGSISSPEKPTVTAIDLCVSGIGVGLAPEASIDQKDLRKEQDFRNISGLTSNKGWVS